MDFQRQTGCCQRFGGAAPAGALPSLGAAGITCDMCHNVGGPDLTRSFQQDGFANMSLMLNQDALRRWPVRVPGGGKGNFHVATNDQSKIAISTERRILQYAAMTSVCRIMDLTALESNSNPGGQNVKYLPARESEYGMADRALQQHQQSFRPGRSLPGLPYVAISVRRDIRPIKWAT